VNENSAGDEQELIGEHYRIDRELGHGGMATVYLCTDSRSGNQVAVKLLRPEVGGIVTKERFLREIQFAKGFEHPAIPRVLESGIFNSLPFYAMDYVEGETLRDRLKRETRLPVPETLRIATEIAKPMSYAHKRGILHRDIKPENIQLGKKLIFVLDFGVARALLGSTDMRLTRTGITVGTPAYMSPEQVTAERDLDPRSDIYSFGCVVYEMLSGTPPFRGASPQVLMASRFKSPPAPLGSIRDDIPAGLVTAIAKAMAKMPEDRWSSAADFVAAMNAA
jgi:serine/threonine-protein kinase